MSSDEGSRWAALIEREAEGEQLSADEQAFVERYAATHAEAKAELEVLRGLKGALSATPRREQPGDRQLIAQVFEQGRQLERGRLRRAAVFGGLALAAGLALWLARPSGQQSAPAAQASPPAAASVQAVLAVAAPGVRLDGASASAGSLVRQGQTIQTSTAGACLRLDRDVRACLAPGSVARLVSLTSDVLISLESGALAADLGAQPPGTSFAVQSGSRVVRAVGTRFGVEVAVAATFLSVVSGTVEVRGDGTTYRVGAPSRTELGSHRIEQLSEIDRQATARLLAPLLAASEPEQPAAVAEESSQRALPAAPGPAPSAESAGDLLARAREQRASGSMKDAAKAYRRLLSEHPGSAEAHAARVALGQLELSALADPSGALAHFSEYLRRGGPLEQEAHYGQVRALSALGRSADERRAVERFLAKYPKAMQSAALKERLKTLSGASATLEK